MAIKQTFLFFIKKRFGRFSQYFFYFISKFQKKKADQNNFFSAKKSLDVLDNFLILFQLPKKKVGCPKETRIFCVFFGNFFILFGSNPRQKKSLDDFLSNYLNFQNFEKKKLTKTRSSFFSLFCVIFKY